MLAIVVWLSGVGRRCGRAGGVGECRADGRVRLSAAARHAPFAIRVARVASQIPPATQHRHSPQRAGRIRGRRRRKHARYDSTGRAYVVETYFYSG